MVKDRMPGYNMWKEEGNQYSLLMYSDPKYTVNGNSRDETVQPGSLEEVNTVWNFVGLTCAVEVLSFHHLTLALTFSITMTNPVGARIYIRMSLLGWPRHPRVTVFKFKLYARVLKTFRAKQAGRQNFYQFSLTSVSHNSHLNVILCRPSTLRLIHAFEAWLYWTMLLQCSALLGDDICWWCQNAR